MRWRLILLLVAVPIAVIGAEPDKPWVAVHDFTVAPELVKKGLAGWNVAEEMESKLTQLGKYRIVTRAKIAKVLKEKNIGASGSLSPAELGKVFQAEYIVAGEVKKQGDRLVMTAKLLDVSKETGEVEKSFDTWMYEGAGEKLNEPVSFMVGILAEKLTMTPGEFFELGLNRIKARDYESAFEAFREMRRVAPFEKINAILAELKQNPPPDTQLEFPATDHDAGRQFDRALDLMAKNENVLAAKLLLGIQKNQHAGELIKLVEFARALAKNQSERLEAALEAASGKYWSAVKNKELQEKEKDPRLLCEEALKPLYDVLNDKTVFLSPVARRRVEQMVARIEALKQGMYAGPVAEHMWVAPELEIAFIPVKPGILTGPKNADSNNPQIRYRAKIARPFWMAKHEITIKQFSKYLISLTLNDRGARHQVEKNLNLGSEDCPVNEEYNMRAGRGPTWGNADMPMSGVSWQGAAAFCKWLTTAERTAKRLPEGYVYRLPTEAEWEYCARAGNADDRYYFGNDMALLGNYGWFIENSGNALHPVGQKQPNAWGLYDMLGNGWEWCHDWYDDNFLSFDCENPVGPKNSPDNAKTLRGGSFTSGAEDMACSARYSFDYKSSRKNIGFRIVCAPAL